VQGGLSDVRGNGKILEKRRQPGEWLREAPCLGDRQLAHDGAPARLVLSVPPADRLAGGVVDAIAAGRLDDFPRR
jgi:hypothetical protein